MIQSIKFSGLLKTSALRMRVLTIIRNIANIVKNTSIQEILSFKVYDMPSKAKSKTMHCKIISTVYRVSTILIANDFSCNSSSYFYYYLFVQSFYRSFYFSMYALLILIIIKFAIMKNKTTAMLTKQNEVRQGLIFRENLNIIPEKLDKNTQ